MEKSLHQEKKSSPIRGVCVCVHVSACVFMCASVCRCVCVFACVSEDAEREKEKLCSPSTAHE